MAKSDCLNRKTNLPTGYKFLYQVKQPDKTIASMVQHQVIQELCGASHYSADTVRRWLSAVAPLSVKEKRGRPRKNSAEDNE
jgi:hypothetical protein